MIGLSAPLDTSRTWIKVTYDMGSLGLDRRGWPSSRAGRLRRFPDLYLWSLVAALVAWLLVSVPLAAVRAACQRISETTRIQTGSVSGVSQVHKDAPRKPKRRK